MDSSTFDHYPSRDSSEGFHAGLFSNLNPFQQFKKDASDTTMISCSVGFLDLQSFGLLAPGIGWPLTLLFRLVLRTFKPRTTTTTDDGDAHEATHDHHPQDMPDIWNDTRSYYSRAGVCYKTHGKTWHPPRSKMCCLAPDRFGLGDWLHQLNLILRHLLATFWIFPKFLGGTLVYEELQTFSQDKLGWLLTSTIRDQNRRTHSTFYSDFSLQCNGF